MPFPNRLNIRVSLCVPPELNKLDKWEGNFQILNLCSFGPRSPSHCSCASLFHSSSCIPEETNEQTTVGESTCGFGLHGCLGWLDSPTDPSGIGLLSWSSLHGTSLPSCFCLFVLNHPSWKCAVAVLGLIAAHRTGAFLPDQSDAGSPQ